jgi:hypothetical protein
VDIVQLELLNLLIQCCGLCTELFHLSHVNVLNDLVLALSNSLSNREYNDGVPARPSILQVLSKRNLVRSIIKERTRVLPQTLNALIVMLKMGAGVQHKLLNFIRSFKRIHQHVLGNRLSSLLLALRHLEFEERLLKCCIKASHLELLELFFRSRDHLVAKGSILAFIDLLLEVAEELAQNLAHVH